MLEFISITLWITAISLWCHVYDFIWELVGGK